MYECHSTSKSITNTLKAPLTTRPRTCRDNDVKGMLCWLVPAHNPAKYAVPIQQPLIPLCRVEDPDFKRFTPRDGKIWLVRCLIRYKGITVPSGHIVVTLFLPLHSLSKMGILYNYPQLTLGGASNTKTMFKISGYTSRPGTINQRGDGEMLKWTQ